MLNLCYVRVIRHFAYVYEQKKKKKTLKLLPSYQTCPKKKINKIK